MSGTWLITGGHGFIGRHLASALLDRGAEVRILDPAPAPPGHPRCRSVQARSREPAAVASALAGADGCFHLATDAATVLAAAAGRVPVVLASSASLYGHQPPGPIRETAPLAPVGAYALEKHAAEAAARSAFEAAGVPSLCLRFFNVYGPRRNPGSPIAGVVSHFMQRHAEGRPLCIEGDGRQIRDLLHVEDAVALLLAGMAWLAWTGGHRVLNGCSGRPVAILELARLLGEASGRPPVLRFVPPRPAEIRWSVGCPETAGRLLGIAPQIGLAEGLRRSWQALAGAPPEG